MVIDATLNKKIRVTRLLYGLGIAGIMLTGTMYWGGPLLLRGLGTYLIVEEPLEPSSAIILLSGHVPFRALEAARLYHEGWAPKVILTCAMLGEESRALAALGINLPEERELNREVLLRRGVPAEAITVIDQEVNNTRSELTAVGRKFGASSGTVILVTSKLHSRRAAAIWNHVTHGQPRAIIRWTPGDPFRVEEWWKDRRFALAVLYEYFGLVNYWFGFPMG